jgi:hypothetical protein
MQLSDFCCNNGSPDGRDVQAGLTDRMVQQRHTGGVLVFPAGGVWFNLQDLRFFPTYFVASTYACWTNFDFQADLVSGYICAP